MSFKYMLLNLLILFVVLIVGIENYHIWTQPIEIPAEHQETVKKSPPKVENPPTVGVNKDLTSLRSFSLISEKNIFSPERKDFPILTAEKSNPATRPQVILYGVTIAGDFQAASLVNPGRSLRKGERETMTLKIGEKIGAYKLAKVASDRIMLENNGDSFEVLLYDPKAPKKRIEIKTEAKPSTPALLASSAPQSAVPGTTPTPPSVEKPPSTASVEKQKEERKQQVVPPAPTPTPRPILPLSQLSRQRRGVMSVYPPTSPPASPTTTPSTGAPEQAQ